MFNITERKLYFITSIMGIITSIVVLVFFKRYIPLILLLLSFLFVIIFLIMAYNNSDNDKNVF